MNISNFFNALASPFLGSNQYMTASTGSTSSASQAAGGPGTAEPTVSRPSITKDDASHLKGGGQSSNSAQGTGQAVGQFGNAAQDVVDRSGTGQPATVGSILGSTPTGVGYAGSGQAQQSMNLDPTPTGVGYAGSGDPSTQQKMGLGSSDGYASTGPSNQQAMGGGTMTPSADYGSSGQTQQSVGWASGTPGGREQIADALARKLLLIRA